MTVERLELLTGPSPDSSELDSNELARYGQLLLSRRHWIAAATVLCALFGVGKYFISPKLYSATTQIQIEPRNLVSVSQDRNPWLDQWTNIKYFPTQYRLLRSRGLAERVIDELRLDRHPAFARSPSDGELADEASAEAEIRYRANTASRLLAGLSVRPIDGTELLDITYVGTDPKLVATLANGFAEAFINWGIDSRAETLSQASRVLNLQITSLRNEVRNIEEGIQAFSRDTEVISTDPASSLAAQELVRLNEQHSAAVTAAIADQQRFASLERSLDEVVAEGAAKPSLRNLDSDLVAYERDYETKLQALKPDHPDMIALQANIEETRRRYRSEVTLEARRIRQAAYNDWQAARRLVDSLNQQRGRVQSDNLALNVESLPLANLQMELGAKRERLGELVERQSQAALSAGVQLETRSNVHVIDRALPPPGPFRPSLRQNVTLGGAAGLMLGIGWVLLLNFFDRTIKSADEIQRLLNMPVLAVIPDIGASGEALRRTYYGPRRKEQGTTSKTEKPIHIERLPESHPRLAVSEAYRSLRTALLLSSAEDLKLITVSSAEASEGKTATSTNLAIVMAQLGKRVLLVDADLRKPRLHKIFNASNQTGLVNCLTSGDHPEGLALRTSITGLDLLSSGPHPPNPSELLASERMRQFCSWARGAYDFVIIDSPPILAVSDAILPSSLSDGVVLCFRANKIVREVARSCAEQLRFSGIKVLGVVLNRYQPVGTGYDDRRYHYYQAYAESSDSAA